MNKVIVFLTICLLTVSLGYSQILTIDDLIVSKVKTKNNPNVIDEGEGNGPHLRVVFTVINDSDEIITLNKNLICISAEFKHNRLVYNEEMIWQPLIEETEIVILPKSSKSFSTNTYIFLGTKLWRESKYDYTLDLLQTLPTFRIKFAHKEFELFSSAINNVIVK